MTRETELAYTPDQTPVVTFGLAVNKRWKNNNGRECEDVCFIECICYGPRGIPVHKYCSKGSAVLIEGSLQYQSWQTQGGGKRHRHVVLVKSVQFLTPKRDNDNETNAL